MPLLVVVPDLYFRSRTPKPRRRTVVWSALSEDRPLFAFAGIWTTFNGDRGPKSKPIQGPPQVYGFLNDGAEFAGRADPSEGDDDCPDDR